jgi:hypothetical protein
VAELKLVTDSEFMAPLISRTVDRIMQVLGAQLGTTDDWEMARSEIISTFLTARVKEQFWPLMSSSNFKPQGKRRRIT